VMCVFNVLDVCVVCLMCGVFNVGLTCVWVLDVFV